MDTNKIIDADFANGQLLSNRGLDFLRMSGILSMVMGIVALVQIFVGLIQLGAEVFSLASMMDMGSEYYYYVLTGLLNRLVTMVFNVFAAVYLFRYAALATKRNKASFGKMEWTTIFESLRNIIVVYGLMNISWLLFSFLNLFIGIFIN